MPLAPSWKGQCHEQSNQRSQSAASATVAGGRGAGAYRCTCYEYAIRATPEKPSEKPALPTQAERRTEAEATRRELKQAIERMNQKVIKDGRKLNFSIDEVTDQMVITVRKAETGEVIRQIPSDAVLRVAHNMEQLKGLLHDKTS